MIKIIIAKLKSNTLASNVERINISLGKYIFLIRDELFANAPIAAAIELAKNNQGRRPA
jgi:hypothetical protein